MTGWLIEKKFNMLICLDITLFVKDVKVTTGFVYYSDRPTELSLNVNEDPLYHRAEDHLSLSTFST